MKTDIGKAIREFVESIRKQNPTNLTTHTDVKAKIAEEGRCIVECIDKTTYHCYDDLFDFKIIYIVEFALEKDGDGWITKQRKFNRRELYFAKAPFEIARIACQKLPPRIQEWDHQRKQTMSEYYFYETTGFQFSTIPVGISYFADGLYDLNYSRAQFSNVEKMLMSLVDQIGKFRKFSIKIDHFNVTVKCRVEDGNKLVWKTNKTLIGMV